jgi:hypothetical protein
MLVWYDEPVDHLAGCVASLKRASVTHLVAVDGAFMLYPSALRRPVSPPEQAAVIADVARQSGIALTLHVPSIPWMGNEVEKRSVMFELAGLTGAEWLLLVDADEYVHAAPYDLLEVLAGVSEPCATVAFTDREGADGRTSIVRLFRNQPGLRVVGTHYGYVSDDHPEGVEAAGIGMVMDVVLQHRPRDESAPRRRRQREFYRLREELGIEAPQVVR